MGLGLWWWVVVALGLGWLAGWFDCRAYRQTRNRRALEDRVFRDYVRRYLDQLEDRHSPRGRE